MATAETFGKEHGRLVRRRLEVSSRLTSEHLGHWPAGLRVCRLTRSTRRKPKGQSTFIETVEIEYGITSAPGRLADADRLLTWWRGHWGIENGSHYVRDVTLHEDACTVHAGHAPQNLAALRNALVSLLRFEGSKNIAESLRNCVWQTRPLLTKLGIVKQ